MKKIISVVVVAIFTIILVTGNISLCSAEIQPDSGSALASAAKNAILQSVGSDKVSLDLKGMDIVEVIKMLAVKGNLNIVLSNDVKGRVTIFLKNVNIMDAFDIILAANNLAYDRRGDIIYIMGQKEYEAMYGERYGDRKEVRTFQLKYAKASEVSKALNQMKTRVGKVVVDDGSNTIVIIDSPQTVAKIGEAVSKIDLPTATRVFELKYAKAADLKVKVTDILTKNVGSAEIDERTNKISVTDLERRMDEIANLVTAFDDKLQQVLIEAKIVQITLDDNYKLGVDWTAVIQKVGTVTKGMNIASTFQLAAQNAFGPPGAQFVIGALGQSDWATMIQVLKEIGDTNLLSSPRITALNNQEAKILVGTSQPYATNTVTQTTGLATTATNLTFIDIGVKLYVTPTINKDGYVTMKIKPEVSNKSGDYTYGGTDNATTVPIVTTTQAETSVTVKDGTTIIIGGLIKDQRTSTVDKIPYLGDIPIAGLAFRKTVKEITKQELVVFLTPHIITGDYDVLEQPKTYPISEKGFTMGENPVFERRNNEKISPGMFKEKKKFPDDEDRRRKEITKGITVKDQDDYFNAVRTMIISYIGPIKPKQGMSTKGTVKVTFVLSDKGKLVGAPKVLKSSNPALEGAAIEAVKKASPFPPFPESMEPGDKRFNINITNE